MDKILKISRIVSLALWSSLVFLPLYYISNVPFENSKENWIEIFVFDNDFDLLVFIIVLLFLIAKVFYFKSVFILSLNVIVNTLNFLTYIPTLLFPLQDLIPSKGLDLLLFLSLSNIILTILDIGRSLKNRPISKR